MARRCSGGWKVASMAPRAVLRCGASLGPVHEDGLVMRDVVTDARQKTVEGMIAAAYRRRAGVVGRQGLGQEVQFLYKHAGWCC
jgi:hypothetical protein